MRVAKESVRVLTDKGSQAGFKLEVHVWGNTQFSETADTVKCQCGTVVLGQTRFFFVFLSFPNAGKNGN